LDWAPAHDMVGIPAMTWCAYQQIDEACLVTVAIGSCIWESATGLCACSSFVTQHTHTYSQYVLRESAPAQTELDFSNKKIIEIIITMSIMTMITI